MNSTEHSSFKENGNSRTEKKPSVLSSLPLAIFVAILITTTILWYSGVKPEITGVIAFALLDTGFLTGFLYFVSYRITEFWNNYDEREDPERWRYRLIWVGIILATMGLIWFHKIAAH